MLDPIFILCVIGFILLLGFSIFLIKYGSKKNDKGKINLPMSIVGWALLVLDIIGAIVGFIIYININGGYTGTIIFTIISPLFILIGFIIILNIGISSLVDGYRKNKEGNRGKASIVKGWALLALAILLITAVVVTLLILFHQHSMAKGDEPVRFM